MDAQQSVTTSQHEMTERCFHQIRQRTGNAKHDHDLMGWHPRRGDEDRADLRDYHRQADQGRGAGVMARIKDAHLKHHQREGLPIPLPARASGPAPSGESPHARHSDMTTRPPNRPIWV